MGTIMARGWPSFLARNSGRTKSSRHWAQEAGGEVYRARDTRLERTVAIKVLPTRFADRLELRQRLEREARTGR